MSQFAPSWDKYNPSTLHLRSKSNPLTADVPSLDYQVAELTWEKRQLAMYGLGRNMLVPWLDHRDAAFINPALDALVPCNKQENSTDVPGAGMVGSCSGGGCCLGARSAGCCKSYGSATATCGGGDSRQVTLDSSDREPTSPENTSSGEYSFEDHDSVFRSGCTSQKRQAGDKGNRKQIGIGISAKSRASAVHNQSERRRREKINQRMKTLQKLVPNSSKTDKASMLDEVIEYLKQLQAQVHMMSRMNMLSIMNMMMMPLPMQTQQHLLLSIVPPSMGMGMGINAMTVGAMLPNAFMPPPHFLSTFLASQAQTQPMTTVDAYSRMAALYQQFQQSSTGSKY